MLCLSQKTFLISHNGKCKHHSSRIALHDSSVTVKIPRDSKTSNKLFKRGKKYVLEHKAWSCKRQCLNKAHPIHREVLEHLFQEGTLLVELAQPCCFCFFFLKKRKISLKNLLLSSLFAYESISQDCSCEMKPSLHTVHCLVGCLPHKETAEEVSLCFPE